MVKAGTPMNTAAAINAIKKPKSVMPKINKGKPINTLTNTNTIERPAIKIKIVIIEPPITNNPNKKITPSIKAVIIKKAKSINAPVTKSKPNTNVPIMNKLPTKSTPKTNILPVKKIIKGPDKITIANSII